MRKRSRMVQSGLLKGRVAAMRLGRAIFLGLALLAAATRAHAQGCALCYTTASAAGAAAEHALNWGILALLAPALVLFLGVILLLFRRALAPAQ